MSDQKSEKNVLAEFFEESAVSLFGSKNRQVEHPLTFDHDLEGKRLVLPQSPESQSEGLPEFWRHLRNFYRTGKGGGLPAEGQFFPALLRPYQDWLNVQRDYPFWVFEGKPDGSAGYAGKNSMPLGLLLADLVDSVTSAEDAKTFHSIIPRLLQIVRQKLVLVDSRFAGYPTVSEAFEDLLGELDISGEEGVRFRQQVGQVLDLFPQKGSLIPFSTHASVHILAAYLGMRKRSEEQKWRDRIRHLLARVNDMLVVERRKDPGATTPDKLESSMEFAGAFLNFEALSGMIPHGGTHLPADRVERLEKIAATLEGASDVLFQKDAYLMLAHGGMDELPFDWSEVYPGFSIEILSGKAVLDRTCEAFEKLMAGFAEVFAALRIAALEVEDQFVPAIHGDFFAHFSWKQFQSEELLACPPVVLVVEEDRLLEKELNIFSKVLARNLPIRILATRKGKVSGHADEVSAGAYGQPLGALAVAHRNAYVLKTSTVSPHSIYNGFEEGLSMPGPALFFILAPEVKPGKEELAYLWASAAIEGREFPAFSFDPELGPKWGSRFDLLDNPQPDRDWPVHRLEVKDANGNPTELELTFTVADLELMDADQQQHFQLVPPEFWSEHLVTIDGFLALPEDELYYKVPFVWAADAEWKLHRVAISRGLLNRCLTRLDFWHYLQENAGIHSYHVEKATVALKSELEAEWEAKLSTLEREHAVELERARTEAASQAMEQLANSLLDLDQGTIPANAAFTSPAAPSTSVEKEPNAEIPVQADQTPEIAAESAEEELLEPGEAYIDTPLCTSCNECININNRIFGYDSNKQAVVLDASAGTFEEIVRAAENCPVGIIHPGAPQHANEANLDALVERAKKFQ